MMTSPNTLTPPVGSRITFNADWTLTQSGPLISGQPIEIEYAAARLVGDAAGTSLVHERPCWTITGSYRIDGGPVTSFSAASPSTSGLSRVDPQVGPLGPGTLELWFETNDLYGESRFDSNYGRNYAFTVYPRVVLSASGVRDYVGSVDGVERLGAHA